MYRVGSVKFALGALIPLNTIALARSGKTLGALRVILLVFQGLMAVWLVGMVVLAITAFFFRRKPDLRTPRVADPRTPRVADHATTTSAEGLVTAAGADEVDSVPSVMPQAAQGASPTA